jgi:RNA polymerase sigma factor (sigma-70 family)
MCNYCTETKLCYYHQKIEDGLIDKPEDFEEVTEEQRQIWDYQPLVRKIALHYVNYTNLGYKDLCQQGYLRLAEIASKIDWLQDRGKITKYVSVNIDGAIKRYIGKMTKAIGFPSWDVYKERGKLVTGIIDLTRENSEDGTEESHDDFGSAAEWEQFDLYSEAPSAEEVLINTDRTVIVRSAIAQLEPDLTERRMYVLWNCLLADEPESYRDVGFKFEVSRQSIARDVLAIKRELKEIINGRFETEDV